MKSLTLTLLCLCFSFISFAQEAPTDKRVVSRIDSTHTPELVLIQEFTVKAPVEAVWKAYTTKAGYENWAVPRAEIDLKVGGTIKSHYDPHGTIGDDKTIVTHIINYVPQQLLTLQAEITNNFPEFMKKEADDFYNVIHFSKSENGTYVQSFGIGYKNTPKFLELMGYFIPANEKLLEKLIDYLEK